MTPINLIALVTSLLLVLYVFRLVVKGKLRVEYSIFWIVTTIILVVFTVWKNGLEYLAKLVHVHQAPNLVFTVAIFAIFVYLLHLSKVNSNLQDTNKKLAQELALLAEKTKEKDNV
ncbi:MAG: DUF2304 domain-containing protein [Flavobacteriales bacterium]|nr:DUF2304 domain-containing protein [Flavobacteriales bacterium]